MFPQILNKWIAPPEADKLINPYKGNAAATAEGEILYNQMCSICHGDLGRGDGIAGLALDPVPKDYTSEKIQAQTDGAIFWKLGEGRPPMASYREALTESQRWKLVNYIRVLGNNIK